MEAGRIHSVNEVIDSLNELNGQTVRVHCVLCLEFEGNCILHLPKIERRGVYDSSLYAFFGREGLDYLGLGVMGVGREECQAFNGRHVIITAIILEEEFRGHFSLWPGSVLILDLAKWKVGD